jgi:capsular polysaccharide transport system ATP-binding protein
MLELRDVWKSSKEKRVKRWILENVSASLPLGRRIALVGLAREDNSLVLRMLSGLAAPEKGSIRCVGLPCWPLGEISFLDMKGTFRQNANFLAHLYGVDPAELLRFATDIAGVKLKKGSPLAHYTGPERRQMALGLTLSLQFDWYFIDEKLPVASPERQDMVDALIADRISRASVIWATNRVGTVDGYCDAGLLLDQGVLTFYDDASDAYQAYRQVIASIRGRRRK